MGIHLVTNVSDNHKSVIVTCDRTRHLSHHSCKKLTHLHVQTDRRLCFPYAPSFPSGKSTRSKNSTVKENIA